MMQVMAEIVPIAKHEYLTEGKWYDAEWVLNGHKVFAFFDDQGDMVFCQPNNCAHLDGGDWQLREV